MVELLVSISVIGALLAILLPALASVRRAAVSGVCKSRLSAIGKMSELYAGEHDGVLPTHAYPLDLQGVADPIFVENWSAGVDGWLILPISEVAFWADLIRGYAGSGTRRGGAGGTQAIEALSCPVVYDRWRDRAETARFDPMWSPQRSYVRSAGLFTSASAWRDPDVPPDVNAAHEPVHITSVRFPASKANLVEAASHHERSPVMLEDAHHERFNVLAMDGHVERRAVRDSNRPVGFVGAVTGFEQPRVAPDHWRDDGLPFVSTKNGSLGRDW